MQALRVHDFAQPPRLDDLPDPVPGPGQVLLQVAACGISFYDLLVMRGGYQVRPPLPFVPGSEFAGTVLALGPGGEASGLAPGDAVFGSVSVGAFAQRLVVPVPLVQKLPSGADLDAAALLSMPAGTALYGLRERGRLRAGECVLVLGATGSVGHAAVQVARALGARVIAACRAPDAATARALHAAGADALLDVATGDWKTDAKALASPRGVDIVFDPEGGEATDTAFRTLGWGGRHLVVGFAGGPIGSLKANLAIVKGAALVGVDLRQYREREPAATARLFADVAALFQQGLLAPQVAGVLPLAQHAEAFARTAARRGVGRLVMRP